MSYGMTTSTYREDEDFGAEPRVTITVEGVHDVSRIVGLLQHGNCEQIDLGSRVVRSLRRHSGGKAALDLLKRHGGPDLRQGVDVTAPRGFVLVGAAGQTVADHAAEGPEPTNWMLRHDGEQDELVDPWPIFARLADLPADENETEGEAS